MLCFLDTEATGLSTTNDRVVQLGAVLVKDGAVHDTFDAMMNCGQPMSRGALRVTGLKQHVLNRAPSSRMVLQDFVHWLSRSSNVVLVAYNGHRFDFPLLWKEFKRVGVKPPPHRGMLDPLVWAKKFVDQSRLARRSSGKCSFAQGDVYRALSGSRS